MKVFSLLFVFLFLVSCGNMPDCSIYTSPIKSIGGCDKFGDCGVALEDGRILHDARQPVIGARARGPYCGIVQ